MDSEAEELYNKEMEKLERQQRELRDRYNTLEAAQQEEDFKNVINTTNTLDYAIRKGETLEQYLTRLNIYRDLAHKKNWKIHVVIGAHGKPWYTHKSANGCFMCEDTNLISYMYNLLLAIAAKHPKLVLTP